MADTEWWQRGPVDGVPAVLQPVAHILLQVRESVGEIVPTLTKDEWNARMGVIGAGFAAGTVSVLAADESFTDLVKRTQAEKPKFAERQQSELAKRYDLSDKPVPGVTMARG